ADQVEEFGRLAAESPDGTVACPWEIFRDYFMQDAAPEAARSVWERLCPQPYQTWTDPLDLTQFFELDTPRSYVACRDDLALPPGAWHPGMSSRLGAFDLFEISGSHEVMFTRPAEVAQAILDASGIGGWSWWPRRAAAWRASGPPRCPARTCLAGERCVRGAGTEW